MGGHFRSKVLIYIPSGDFGDLLKTVILLDNGARSGLLWHTSVMVSCWLQTSHWERPRILCRWYVPISPASGIWSCCVSV